jgi:hypothetical protein
VLRLRGQHPGVRPARRALARQHRLDRHLVALEQVRDHLPGRADGRVPGGERRLLLGVVGPVLAHVLALLLEQVDGRLELLVVELVGVRDLQVGTRRLEVDGGVRDVDRAVVRGDAALIARGVVEHGAPRVEVALDLVGAPHEQVRPVAVRDAVHPAAHRVPGLVLEARVDVGVVWHEVGVDRCDVTPRDQPQGRVAGGRHRVVLARAHQGHHLVGRVADLDVDLAPRALLERRDPVDLRVGGPVLGVAGPCDQVELPLALTDRGRHLRALGRLHAVARVRARARVAAAPRGHRERADRHGRRCPSPADHRVSSCPGMSEVCSSRHPTVTRAPRCPRTSAEEVSRFCRTTCSSPPPSSATKKRVSIPA